MVILLDGSYGMELKIRKARGEPVAHNQELFSTAALRETPEQICRLHRDYIRAGAQVLTTASYAVTRFYLRKVGEAHRVPELARLSVDLARDAIRLEDAGDSVRVAASVPPLGESYNASNKLTEEEEWEQYIELCTGLKGADLFLCETMSSLVETKTAVDACREAAPGKEIWVSFCVLSDEAHGVTLIDGTPIAEAAVRVLSWGISTMMFNCATPELIGSAIKQAVATKLPGLRTGGYGNCWEDLTPAVGHGKWTITMNESTHGCGDAACGGFVVRHDLQSEQYAKTFVEHLDAGASIVGGCCGIGPEAIAAIRDLLEKRQAEIAAEQAEREARRGSSGPCAFGHTAGNCVMCSVFSQAREGLWHSDKLKQQIWKHNEAEVLDGLAPAFPPRSLSGVENLDAGGDCLPRVPSYEWEDSDDESGTTMPILTPPNSLDEFAPITDMGLGMLGMTKSRSDAYASSSEDTLVMPMLTKCRSDPGPLWAGNVFAPTRSTILQYGLGAIRGLTPRNV